MSEKQIFKYFMIGLSVAAAAILGMEIYLGSGVVQVPETAESLPKIDIDFAFLESAALKGLFPFEFITASEESVGRDNPFITY